MESSDLESHRIPKLLFTQMLLKDYVDQVTWGGNPTLIVGAPFPGPGVYTKYKEEKLLRTGTWLGKCITSSYRCF